MPEKYTVKVTTSSLKSGDRLVKQDEIVWALRTGSRYGYVTYTRDHSVEKRFELTDTHDVERERPTEAEKFEMRVEHLLRLADDQNGEAKKKLDRAVERIYELYDGRYAISSFEFEALAKAEAEVEIWAQVKHARSNGHSPLNALTLTVQAVSRKLLRNDYAPRSTSAMSNSLDIAHAEAASRFVNQFGSLGDIDTRYEFEVRRDQA